MLGRLLKRDPEPAAMPDGTPRILLIDADQDELGLLRNALAQAGATYQVEWAPGYEQGLERLGSGGYEVGLVNSRLGTWSGLDLLREARNRDSHVPLIMLTDERDPVIDQLATGLGAVDLLLKGRTSAIEYERAVRFAAANGRVLAGARRAEARMAALEEIGRVLALDGTSAEALDAVIGLVAERLERPYISLYLADGDHFQLAAQRGHEGVLASIARGGQLATALRERKPWVVPNQSRDPETPRATDPHMELSIPLLEETETLGLLFVGYAEDAPIEGDEHAALVSVANRITDALGLAHDRRDVSGRARRMRRLGTFLAQLAATSSRAELEAQLAAAAAGVVDVDGLLIGLALDDDRLKVVSSHGRSVAAPGSTTSCDPIARRALQEGRPASVTEPQPARLDGRGAPDRWSAALPLSRGGRNFGVIQFSRPTVPFDVFEREAATFLAALVALLLSNCAQET